MAEMTVDERWRELVRLYGEKSDGELEELRGDFAGLTDVAQGVLRDEMRRRGIWREVEAAAPAAAAWEWDESAAEGTDANWREFDAETLGLGGIVVRVCEDERDEALSRFLLDRARIQSVVMQGFGQVKVPPGCEERALAVLERGPSPAMLAEFERQYAEEQSDAGFVEPTCGKCGSNEVMLELNDAGNEWVCPDCGNRWEETVAV